MSRPTFPAAGNARPLAEPLVAPRFPADTPTRRINAVLDRDRYARFKKFVAESGLTGALVVVIALDRLMTGR